MPDPGYTVDRVEWTDALWGPVSRNVWWDEDAHPNGLNQSYRYGVFTYDVDVNTAPGVTTEVTFHMKPCPKLDIVTKGRGVVKSDPPCREFLTLHAVNLLAEPCQGWVFDHWEGEVADAYDASTEILVADDTTVTAVFRSETDTRLEIAVYGEGTVSVSPDPLAKYCDAETDYRFPLGTEVILTVIPAEGYEFVGWVGDVEPIEGGKTGLNQGRVGMNGDRQGGPVFGRAELAAPVVPETGYDVEMPVDTPGMPDLTVEFSVNAGAQHTVPQGTMYRVKVGRDGVAVIYPNKPAAPQSQYRDPPQLVSPELEAPTWSVDWNLNNEVTDHGLYGGQVRYLTLEIDIPQQNEPPGFQADFTHEVDFGKDVTDPDELKKRGIHIVGAALDRDTIIAYVDNLTMAKLAGDTDIGPTGVQILQLDLPTSGTMLLPDYIFGQIKIIVQAITRKESGQKHFAAEGDTDIGTPATEGGATRVGYPLVQMGDKVPDDKRGYGLMQLTSGDYLRRTSIWNWQKNMDMAVKALAESFYKRGCEHLDTHTPAAEHVDRMRRLEAYNRYNGGEWNRYHWWNANASCVYASVVGSQTSGAKSEGNTFRGSLTGIHSLDAPGRGVALQQLIFTVTQGELPTYLRIEAEDGTALAGGFLPYGYGGWILDFAQVLYRTELSDTAHSQYIPFYMAAYSDAYVGGKIRGRIVEGNPIIPVGAGFLPLEEDNGPHYTPWTEFGYVIPLPTEPMPTSPCGVLRGAAGYRDNNLDCVRDPDENPYGIPPQAVDAFGGTEPYHGSNRLLNRASRYADGAIQFEQQP